MKYEFYLPKIETRSALRKGIKEFIIRGYAATAGNSYAYKKESNSEGVPVRNFKEYFTTKAIESIKRQAENERIWIDYGHEKAFDKNVQKLLNDIETRSGLSLSDEKSYLINAFKEKDIPMFKVKDIKIDDKGLFVEIKGNPFYRDVDNEHKVYFDAIWNSLEQGFINGMSLNFKPIEFEEVGEGINKIDDVDVYGISLTGGAANGMANITEVATRAIEHSRGEAICQTKRSQNNLTRRRLML